MSEEIRISKLSKKKKNYIVTVDTKEYIFDEDTLVQFGLYQDRIFSKTEFDNILLKRDNNQAFNMALKYLALGMKSISEIIKHLEKKAFDNSIIDDVISRLKQLGYLDDIQYSKNTLQYYQSSKKGPQYIIKKLYEKNISRKVIEEVIQEYTEEREYEIIDGIIQKEQDKHTQYPIKKQRQLISEKLIRNGFTPSIVFSIINEMDLIDNSEEKLKSDYNKILKTSKFNNLSEQDKKQKIITSLINKGYEYQNILSLLE